MQCRGLNKGLGVQGFRVEGFRVRGSLSTACKGIAIGIQRVQVRGQLKSNCGESNGKENARCIRNWIVGMVCRGPFNQNRVWSISSHCSLRCYSKDSEGECR